MISTVINNQIPKNEKHKPQYRSFRSVAEDAINIAEMKDVKLTGDTEDKMFNSHAVYDKFETDISNVFDKHAPIKERYVKQPVTLYE